jgi:hypothetical protein
MKSFVATLIVIFVMALPVQSQNGVTVRGTFGATKAFLDEPFAAVAGGAVLIPIGRRFAIGPEFHFSRVSGFEDRSFLGTGIFYLTGNSRITPYVTANIGMLRDRDTSINFTLREWTGGGGAGLRIATRSGLFAAPEVRIGSHAFPMVVVHLGYSF